MLGLFAFDFSVAAAAKKQITILEMDTKAIDPSLVLFLWSEINLSIDTVHCTQDKN